MAKLAKISVSRSGTSATVTLENFEAGDEWNVYRANKSGDGTYSQVASDHDSATFGDTGLTSGDKYSWKASMIGRIGSNEVINTSTEVINTSTEIIGGFQEQQRSTPRYSNP